MQQYFFWLNWDQPLKFIASLLFFVLIMLISASMVLIILGPEGIIGWHTFSQKTAVDVVSQTINVGPFSFPFSEQLMVIKEFVSGAKMPSVALVKEVAAIFIIVCTGIFIALITYLNRFGFILFSTFIFFFIIFLHPEMLKMADVHDRWILVGMFMLFIAPAYYFQAFGKNASIGVRLTVMLGVVGIFLLVVVTLSPVQAPLNLLFSYGVLAPYLVVLLFIFMVGHEIISGFILAIASGKQEAGNNRIKHFLAISVIYLLNVLFSYLQITHVIRWDFITINPIFLLAVAAILGVWGISQRFVLYKKASASQQVWVLLYLIISVIAFATISYLLFSLEDPLVKIINDFVIFTQLAFGAAFLLYVLYNFISIIEQGHSVKDILYQPQNLPHVSYRVLGVAILTGIVLMRDINYPIWYSLGGHYNSIASYFEDIEDDKVAILFYERGADLSKRNHKSNYKLGMYHIDDDRTKAIEYFGIASERMPTAQAFVNKANLESDLGNYFESLFTLQKGNKQLRHSSELKNNLALQFGKSKMLDSAWHYFVEAKSFHPAQNNALGFVLKHNFAINAQDSSFLFDKLNKVGQANAAALGYQPTLEGELSGDNMMNAALLNNALVNQLIPFTSSSYSSIVQLIDSTKNESSLEELNYALAIYELRNELISNALNRLQKLTTLGSDNQARYFELLGLVNLEYKAYTKAEEYFMLANEYKQLGQRSYTVEIAVAQSEGSYFTDAIQTWELVKQEGTTEDSLKSIAMIQILSSIVTSNDSIQANDINLYIKARYQRLWVDEFAVKGTFEQIKEAKLKNELALDLAAYYFNTGNNAAAKLFYDKIEDDDESILRPLLLLNIRMAYAGLVPDLEAQINNLYDAGFEFSPAERLEKLFYTSDKNNIAPNIVEMFGTQNPFFAEGVVWAANYFKNDADAYKSYNLLQESLTINPDNRLLLEAYILEAIRIGFEEYAGTALQHYRALFPGDLFYVFLQKVEEQKAKFNAMADEEA